MRTLNSGLGNVFLWVAILVVAYMFGILSVHGIEPKVFGTLAVLIIVTFSYIFWRKAIILIVFWVMFSGIFRKWIIPEASEIIYFFGHAILTGVYIRYFLDQAKNQKPIFLKHNAGVLIMFLLFWSIACIFNPELSNIPVGLLGLVVYFYYIPLIFIIPKIFQDKKEIIKLLKLVVVFSFPMLVLGIVQFYSPVDHPINIYVSEAGIALVGEYPRITSTFSYIAGYATFLIMLVLILLYLMSLKDTTFKYNIFLYFVFALCALNILMTGSRMALYYSVFCVVMYLFLTGSLQFKLMRRFLPRIILALALIFLIFNFTGFGRKIVDAFMTRIVYEEQVERVMDLYKRPFAFIEIAGLYGYGLGTTYQGSIALGHNPHPYYLEEVTGGYEDEPERVMLEVGLVGFIMIYLLRLFYIYNFWGLFRKLKDIDLKNLSLILLLFQIQFISGVNMLVFNHTSNLLYWYFIGFMFALPRLDNPELVKEEV